VILTVYGGQFLQFFPVHRRRDQLVMANVMFLGSSLGFRSADARGDTTPRKGTARIARWAITCMRHSEKLERRVNTMKTRSPGENRGPGDTNGVGE